MIETGLDEFLRPYYEWAWLLNLAIPFWGMATTLLVFRDYRIIKYTICIVINALAYLNDWFSIWIYISVVIFLLLMYSRRYYNFMGNLLKQKWQKY